MRRQRGRRAAQSGLHGIERARHAGGRVSHAVDAVMLACAEALARWRRPSASAWGLIGPGALRMALGAPLSTPVLDVAVAADDPVDLEEIAGFLHVVAAARVSSRLGSQFDLQRTDAPVPTLRVSALEERVEVDVRFPALRGEELLGHRQRWPIARLQSECWPGWGVAALVATPRMLLADALWRVAGGVLGADADVRWLIGRGVSIADRDVLEGRAGLTHAWGTERLRELARGYGVAVDLLSTAAAAEGMAAGRDLHLG